MPQTKGKVGDDKLVSWIDQKQKASLFIRCVVKPLTLVGGGCQSVVS